MKKQFQILSLVIVILFFSCGKHNAGIAGTMTTGTKELPTDSFFPGNEPDLLLIDHEGQIRFGADPRYHAKDPGNVSSFEKATYTIERTKETILLID